MSETTAWLILLLPLFSFLLISFIIRPFVGATSRVAGYVTILAIGSSFILSLLALGDVIRTPSHHIPFPSHPWMTIGSLTVSVGVMMDSLTAIMLVVVTSVSLLIQIYSQGYMKGDKGYVRYYAYMSLFTTSMLGLVLASNLVLLYTFWELVGLCSYLLIGFWFHRPAAAAAAKKAFIVTRFGDLGFLIAIVFIFHQTGTLDIVKLYGLAAAGALGGAALTWFALGVFAGAMGKSAQFPLHTWLPDAMEGPTPVSALIHAATMVAAGVFLVSRMFPVFEHSSQALTTVAWIGGITAVFAASMGLVMNDIKRVMAYSTVSQLGYMMMSLGLGSVVAAMFHLFNHAFFKALLFLGAGSVNHATGTFDMRFMGGLRKVMPWTFITLLVAALSLSGIPPFSGFWSKDEILLQAFHKNSALFVLGLVGAFMTAFYVFRALFMTFEGEYKGGASAESGGGHSSGGGHEAHPHESPAVMLIPMILLAIPAIISGIANLPVAVAGVPAHWMGDLFGSEEAGEFDISIVALSSGVAVAGILLAWATYAVRRIPADFYGRAFGPLYQLLSRRYYIDDLYEKVLVTRVLYRGVSVGLDWWDRNIVDGVVNGVALIGRNVGRGIARAQTGQLQAYGVVISLGILIIFLVYLMAGR